MDALIEGMSLDDVKKIDSEGDYSFIYRIWLDYPKMSYHYLADGSAYVISYDDNDFINYIYSFIL